MTVETVSSSPEAPRPAGLALYAALLGPTRGPVLGVEAAGLAPPGLPVVPLEAAGERATFEGAIIGPGALARDDLARVLLEVRRRLVPGGVLLLLANRRRPLARRSARRSARRIARLLAKCGFGRARRAAILPAIETPQVFLPRRARGAKRLRERIARRRLAADLVAPTIMIAGCERPSLIAEAAARFFAASGARRRGPPLERRVVRVSSHGTARVELDLERDGRRGKAFLKLALDPRARPRIVRAARVLADVRADPRLAAEDRALVPELLFFHEESAVLVEGRLPGREARRVLEAARYGPRTFDAIFGEAMDFLARLHAATARRAPLGEAMYERLLGAQLATLERALAGDDRRRAARLARAARGSLVGRTIPLVLGHGDFHFMNVLAHRGRLSGVLDWEFASEPDLPVLDAFHFLLGPEWTADLGIGWGIVTRLVPWNLTPAAEHMLERYLAAVGVERETALALRVAYWARKAAAHAENLRGPGDAWYDEMIRGPLAAFGAEG